MINAIRTLDLDEYADVLTIYMKRFYLASFIFFDYTKFDQKIVKFNALQKYLF